MQVGLGEAEEAEETNSTFDAVAARAQAERIAQRRRVREQEQGKKQVE